MRTLVLVFLVWVALGAFAFRHAKPPPPAAEEEPRVTACGPGPAPSLVWLARHQSADGRWSGTRFADGCSCTGRNPAADDEELTGLALLAFLGAGYTPQNRSTFVDSHSQATVRFGEVVRRGIKYLLSQQAASGAIGTSSYRHMKAHAVAALALLEAYGITNAVAYRTPAAMGIAFIESSRAPGGVWGVAPHDVIPDDATTVECAMALKSGLISGFDIAPETSAAILAWAHERPAVDAEDAAFRLVSEIFFEKRKGKDMAELASAIGAPPPWEARAFHHWEYATMALFQYDGPEGPTWKSWNKKIASTLCDHQALRKDGCADGSWDGPCGPVRATAEATLTLEIYYRYASVFGSK